MNSNRVNQLQSGSWTPTELTHSNLDEPQTELTNSNLDEPQTELTHSNLDEPQLS
jgi:hypothetical protein